MRRTIAQSALVFASVLLIIALAGCGGSGKKAAPPAPAPMPVTLELPDGHDLETVVIVAGGRETIEAGGNRYTLSCPVGGEACSITVAENGAATYAATGGTPTVSGPTVIMRDLAGLPGGHGLATGEIAAGRSSTRYDAGRTIVVTCPGGEDAAACSLTVAEDGAVTYAATGGTPTVRVTTNELVWQANNGPAGTSDGAHAVGLARRLVARSGTPDSIGTAVTSTATGLGNGEGSMQTTLPALPVVTPSMEWTRGDSPTLGLTLGSTTFSGLDSGSLPTDSGKLSVDSGSGSVIPSLGRGWNGAALSKDLSEVNGKTLRGVVYTNAEEPTGGTADTPARTFAEDFDLSGHSALSTLLGAAADPTEAQELTIEGFKVTIPAADIARLRTGAAQNTPITVSVEDGGTTRSNVRLACAVLTCRNVGGNLQGTWTLRAPKVTGTAGTQDTDYQVLGSWLVLPNDADATSSYNLGVFQFSSSARLARTNLDGNSGDITFEGPATGVYTTGAYTGTGNSRRVTSADVGSFTADVELVGDFGASGGAGTFAGVTGTVNSFTDASGNSLGWTMSLQDTGAGSAGTDELFTGDTVLETREGQSAGGDWSVGFYWNTQRTPSPGLGLAGGTFDASTAASEDSHLHVVGAFAAERQ